MTPPQSAAALEESAALKLLHELQLHREELFLQNLELDRARGDLAGSLARYMALYETAPVGLVSLDERARVLQANQRSRTLLLDARDETVNDLVGEPLVRWLTAGSQAALAPLLAGHSVGPVDLQTVADPPAILRAEACAGPSEQGGLLLALTDVTAQRVAETELARTREVLELCNRAARIGTWELSLHAGHMIWSAMTCELHGQPVGYRPSLDEAIQFGCDDGSRARLRGALQQALAHGLPFDIELQIELPDGARRWVRKIGLSQTGPGGCERLYGSFQDIDERVQAETERLARARIEAAHRSRSVLLSRISHELRTPLNAVIGFSELLQRTEPVRSAPEALGRVRHILSAGQHLLAMIDDVLDLSRVEAGELRLQLQAVALAPVLDQALALLEPQAAAQQVSLHCGALPEGLEVQADALRLRQVLSNLLSNAVKYNHPGGWVRVQVRCDGGLARIDVADGGPGLSVLQQAGLFEPFNRLGAERSAVPGTGLGLVIVRQLVEAMHGRLTVHSVPGEGSVFSVHLPCAVSGTG